MTHAERAERRAAAVEMVRGGKTVAETAGHFGLEYGTVKQACAVAGLVRAAEHTPPRNAFKILAAMLKDPTRRVIDIAREFSVSSQRISQVRHAAIEAGVPGIAGRKEKHAR